LKNVQKEKNKGVETMSEEEQTKEENSEDNNKSDEKTEEVKKEEDNNPSSIDEAKKVLEQIEEQNKIMSANIRKAEKITVDNLMAGRSKGTKELIKDEQDNEEAKKLVAGSGYEEDLFPTK